MKQVKLLIILLGMITAMGVAFAGQLQNYPLTSTLTDSATIPVVQTTNQNINWSNMKAIMTTGINWSAIPNVVNNTNINWVDLQTQAAALAGINWYLMSNQGNGINWYRAANGGTTGTIWCTKPNGQPGKCGTSISGVTCTNCN